MEPPTPFTPAAYPVALTAHSQPLRWERRTVAQLVELYEQAWDPVGENFMNLPFDLNGFTELLEAYTSNCGKYAVREQEVGYVMKKVLPHDSEIFTRGDLHGDLRSLLDNLNVLQQQGLLNEHFECMPFFHMLFLGDYVDRGPYSVHVLQVLLTLHMENRNVILIQGNHEAINMNDFYNKVDGYLTMLLQDDRGRISLERAYKSMPLGAYIGVEVKEGVISSPYKQFVAFAHGGQEFIDLNELLKSPTSEEYLGIPKKRVLSPRIQSVFSSRMVPIGLSMNRQRRLVKAAITICGLFQEHLLSLKSDTMTSLSWGDMQEDGNDTQLGALAKRDWNLSPNDLKQYFDLNSIDVRIKMLFRGHEHTLRKHCFTCTDGRKKLVAITLPTSPNTPWARKTYQDQADVAYVLKLAGPKVKDWLKTLYQRPVYSRETFVAKPELIGVIS